MPWFEDSPVRISVSPRFPAFEDARRPMFASGSLRDWQRQHGTMVAQTAAARDRVKTPPMDSISLVLTSAASSSSPRAAFLMAAARALRAPRMW